MYCCCPLVRSVAPIDQEDFATSRCRKKRSSRYRITFVRRTFQKRKTHYRRQHHHREHCHHHLRFDKIRKTCQNNITSICPSLQRLRQCVRAGLLSSVPRNDCERPVTYGCVWSKLPIEGICKAFLVFVHKFNTNAWKKHASGAAV